MKRLLTLLLLLASAGSTSATQELPSLGDSTSGLISLHQEKELGQEWLRALRSQAPTIDDPLAITWFRDLVYELVPHSGLQDTDLSIIVVDSPELNAFAVPGGIVGINLGLLLYSDDEDQVASVLAHELAHLSQRHFARQVEAAQRRDPVTLATLLASIVLIATNNTDAGVAGLVGSQAAAIQNQLAYSRDFEREADRLGMVTLSRSGMDAHAMTDMFSNMMSASRYRGSSLEFLMTHPLTSARVADAAGRAAQYPEKQRQRSFSFQVLRLLAEARYQLKDEALAELERRLEKSGPDTSENHDSRNALLYALARLSFNREAWKKGEAYADQITYAHPAVTALRAQLTAEMGDAGTALTLVKEARRNYPADLSLRLTQAMLLDRSGKAPEAVTILKKITEDYPENPAYWATLSKTASTAGDSVLAYRALGESYFYSGRKQEAAQQLRSAIKEAARLSDFQREAAIRERLKVVEPLKDSRGRP